MLAVVAGFTSLGGCQSGGGWGAEPGDSLGALGLILGPLVVVGYLTKDVFEFFSAPAPWDNDEEISTQ